MHTTPWVALGNDKYFDDNSLAVVTLVDCGNNTGNWRYLDRAWEVFDRFVRTGLGLSKRRSRRTEVGNRSDQTEHDRPGRLRDCTRSARGIPPGGVLPPRSERLRQERHRRVGTGKALDWIWDKLRDPTDNLLWNSLQDKDGAWPADKTKWTYLPGLTIAGMSSTTASPATVRGLSRATHAW